MLTDDINNEGKIQLNLHLITLTFPICLICKVETWKISLETYNFQFSSVLDNLITEVYVYSGTDEF